MTKLSYKEFEKIYDDTLQEVYTFWNDEMQEYIAEHNKSWSVGNFNFFNYLSASKVRYYEAYSLFDNKSKIICDVGGFFGVFPTTLSKLGYEVYMTEALKYYTSAFDNLFTFIENSGVNILDVDPFEKNVLPTNRFDEIVSMAVIEHYPHSLKDFLENLSKSSRYGNLIIEVPNFAYLPNRIKLLKGETPLSDIDMIYKSKIPFTGHHHEFVYHELEQLMSSINYKVIKSNIFNYSNNIKDLSYIMRNPFKSLVMNLFKNTRECIIIKAKSVESK